MNFDLQFAWEILPVLLEGLVITVQATVIGFGLAVVLGLFMALGRRSHHRWIAWPVGAVVEFIRLTPFLVQLFFLFYVLPRYGVRLSAFTIGVVALGLHYGTYISEVYRAGIDAVAIGQWEAGKSLNLSPFRTWTHIILPQAIPPMIPALGNYLVGMFKETPQLGAITVIELLWSAKIIGSQTFRYVEPITMVGLLFLLLSLPSAFLVRRLEARFIQQR